MRGGQAVKAGIQPTRRESSRRVILGDMITAIDSKKVESPNDLFLVLENYQVGDVVTLALLRDGKTIQTKVTLEAVSWPRPLIAKRSGSFDLSFVQEVSRGNLIFVTLVGGYDLLH
jgi:PDZ domain